MRKILAPQATEKTKIQKVAFSSVEKLREGAVLVVAVENSYVAIVDPASEEGLETFKSIKEYGEDIFYPVFINAIEDLAGFVAPIGDTERLIASKFWPGLLNIEFKGNRVMPHNLGANSTPETVVARKPKNPLLNAISDLIGPIIYTSLMDEANVPIRNLTELTPRLRKLITLAIDSGDIKSFKKSTLVSCVGKRPKVTRPGSIPSWKIKKIVPDLQES